METYPKMLVSSVDRIPSVPRPGSTGLRLPVPHFICLEELQLHKKVDWYLWGRGWGGETTQLLPACASASRPAFPEVPSHLDPVSCIFLQGKILNFRVTSTLKVESYKLSSAVLWLQDSVSHTCLNQLDSVCTETVITMSSFHTSEDRATHRHRKVLQSS